MLGKGTVERVDIVRRRNDPSPFCRIFVHMRFWPVNVPEIANWRDMLIRGDTLKVVYDEPWFWRCSASNKPKPVSNREAKPPYIVSNPEITPAPPASPIQKSGNTVSLTLDPVSATEVSVNVNIQNNLEEVEEQPETRDFAMVTHLGEEII